MPDYSSFQLKDKVAVVTGASQGIGRAIVIGFAQTGPILYWQNIPGPRLQEIEALERKAVIVMTDVNRVEDCRELMRKTVSEFGYIDILVNNASWTGTGDAIDVTEEEYGKTFDTTVKSIFFASQAAAKVNA